MQNKSKALKPEKILEAEIKKLFKIFAADYELINL